MVLNFWDLEEFYPQFNEGVLKLLLRKLTDAEYAIEDP